MITIDLARMGSDLYLYVPSKRHFSVGIMLEHGVDELKSDFDGNNHEHALMWLIAETHKQCGHPQPDEYVIVISATYEREMFKLEMITLDARFTQPLFDQKTPYRLHIASTSLPLVMIHSSVIEQLPAPSATLQIEDASDQIKRFDKRLLECCKRPRIIAKSAAATA